jgi:hypothetical protein
LVAERRKRKDDAKIVEEPGHEDTRRCRTWLVLKNRVQISETHVVQMHKPSTSQSTTIPDR